MRFEQRPAMSDQLDQLAAQLRAQVNQVHNRGANTPFGQCTGAADPAAMYGSRTITTPTDPLTLGSDVTFAILDADGNYVTGPMTLAAGATTTDTILTAINGSLTKAPGSRTAAWNTARMEIKQEGGSRLANTNNAPAAPTGYHTLPHAHDAP